MAAPFSVKAAAPTLNADRKLSSAEFLEAVFAKI
jgi:hypothetical protein